MDWQGQKLAEQLMQIMLVAFAGVTFLTGGVILATTINVPNWPFFNRHPLKWLDPVEAEKHPKPQSTNTNSKKKTSKK